MKIFADARKHLFLRGKFRAVEGDDFAPVGKRGVNLRDKVGERGNGNIAGVDNAAQEPEFEAYKVGIDAIHAERINASAAEIAAFRLT